MAYRVLGLDPAPFRHLYGLSDSVLAAKGVQRHIADAKPGFPDRIELRDAEPDERLLLLNYVHQPADTPYRASHAIFVREGAEQAVELIDVIPDVLRVRPISLRAFNARGEMIDADLVAGTDLEPLIERFFGDLTVDYLHAHFARRGCYAARIERS
ncbi:Protein of unknown function [Sphingomonas sp. YR710]|jgi:hypothetical protein|uniref:DUF1203 domain-containing protein n=1 Tax=Sphingomonas sp. YR710 TaxID=1882773 RepID=UPI0008897977|nr:DUF1203 domain-containing protein [Sphingomonas sp. YR710]SDC28280.1 Protein of unknown function [Sphingomonas sp. YR710]